MLCAMGWNPIYLTHGPPTFLTLQAPQQHEVDTQASTEVATPEENCLGVFVVDHICLPNVWKEFTPASDLPSIEPEADSALAFQSLNRN